MKTTEEIFKQTPVFLHFFENKEEVFKEFKAQDTEKINILFASYGCANYQGDAFVLFEKDGNLFEVNGGHCSCYGLEDQWSPEETNLKVLKFRLEEGTLGNDDYSGNLFSEELKTFLGI